MRGRLPRHPDPAEHPADRLCRGRPASCWPGFTSST
jgi:hypothetical protein